MWGVCVLVCGCASAQSVRGIEERIAAARRELASTEANIAASECRARAARARAEMAESNAACAERHARHLQCVATARNNEAQRTAAGCGIGALITGPLGLGVCALAALSGDGPGACERTAPDCLQSTGTFGELVVFPATVPQCPAAR